MISMFQPFDVVDYSGRVCVVEQVWPVVTCDGYIWYCQIRPVDVGGATYMVEQCRCTRVL